MDISSRKIGLRALVTVAATSCVALAAAPTALAAAGAPRADGSNFSCRASALRVNFRNATPPTVEPVVANGADAPCLRNSAAIVNRTAVGPLTVDLADASTNQTPTDLSTAPATNGDNARADASVTNPVFEVPGLRVTATVLSASASYTCQNGQAIPAGNSTVANLTINGQAITLPPNNAPFKQDVGPVGTVLANQTVQANGRITQRALEIRVPNDGSVIDVVLGEATADITGNPCAVRTGTGAGGKPQCSDGVDNDGDGLIDANDPGCLSGPGGTYNPADDDEADAAAAAKPQCSDGVDNDGDGKIDAQDPGCLSGPGGTYNPNDNDETDTAKSQCSDGKDNDGDGKIDFPKDRGCSSASDTTERTAKGTGRLTTVPSGVARLGLRGPCTKSSFAAVVRGRSIDRVVFLLDGRTVMTDTSSPFTARISTGRAGVHRVSARVTFLSDSRTKTRTLSFAFRRCAAPVRFTG